MPSRMRSRLISFDTGRFGQEYRSPEMSSSVASRSNIARSVWLKVASTSVELRGLEMSAWRKLRAEEIGLIAALVRNNPDANMFLDSLPTLLIEDMKDGGMGSLRFKSEADRARRFGKKIAEAEYTDADGVPVSAAVNLDDHGELFELDI